MSADTTAPMFIGWDVSRWNYDNNPGCRDALAVHNGGT